VSVDKCVLTSELWWEALMASDDKAKILVVDDLAENLLSYHAILEDLRQEVVAVSSGEEALKEILKHDFAVILLDVNMPGLDGFETAALIRKRKRSAHTPIIFLTAFTDELRATEGYAHGAVDYIASPVVPAILRAKVRVFVDLYHLAAQIRRHAAEQVVHAEERTKREAAEESNRRLAFLARAGATVTKSLDRQATVESMLSLMLPDKADEAAFIECEGTGRWHGVGARMTEEGAGFQPLPNRASLSALWAEAVERAFATGMTCHLPSAEIGNGQGHTEVLALPLRDRDRVFGVLLLVRRAACPPYSVPDVAMFESIAWRCGIALVNAKLYGEIEWANQQKNHFLSMLAHELRNPLAPIRSAVDVLRLCRDNPADIEWAGDVIDRQVNHLIRLVDDLLDISRITLGKIRLQTESIAAAELLTAAVEICHPLVEKQGHRLSVHVPDEPVMLIGDRARLTQVLANLLNNAAKYTPPGGEIACSLEHDGGEAVFRVRDTGIGIPAPMLDKVFDMFIQVDNGLDRAHGGLGIGLTLVRELVAMHHGKIRAVSAGPNQGSEFIVRLPLAPPTEKATADSLCLAASGGN
jgi:signal transduction histidine kinase/DNA-binding response OmpR family regulator